MQYYLRWIAYVVAVPVLIKVGALDLLYATPVIGTFIVPFLMIFVALGWIAGAAVLWGAGGDVLQEKAPWLLPVYLSVSIAGVVWIVFF